MQMSFQILISTMRKNPDDIKAMLEKNNIRTDALIINQGESAGEIQNEWQGHHYRVLSTPEKGLSRSRNMAIEHADAEICLLADDDILYEDDVELTVTKAFEENPEYDCIAFYVNRSSTFAEKTAGTQREMSKWDSMGVMSVQLAFRRSAVLEKQLRFDELFGAGSDTFICGEENIFLSDCFSKGLKLLYVPVLIAHTFDNDSTWFTGYNEMYFQSKGAVFYRMYHSWYWLMVAAFAILKRSLYVQDTSMWKAVIYMFKGKKEFLRKKDCHEN